MEDKILKQIEEEALRSLKAMVDIMPFELSMSIRKYVEEGFIIMGKFGYNIKESVRDNQSVNAKLVEALSIMLNYESVTKEEYKECWKVYNSAISASQNTVSKSAPSQVVEEAMKAASINVRVPNVVRNGDVVPQNTVSNEGEKWVSVDDRLPEAYETIISYNIHTDEVSTDYIDDEKRWDVLNPTHWMPLPQPPKEK